MAYLRIWWRRHRKESRPPDHQTFPETPQGYYEGWYPGSRRVEAHRFEHRVRHQVALEAPEFPAAAPEAPFVATVSWGFYRSDFTVRPQLSPLELNVRPETPAAYYEGWYPGSGAVRAHRVEYRVQLQLPQQLDEYPETPAAVPFVATIEVGKHQFSFDFSIQRSPHPHEFPATPVDYYSGFFPGSALATSHRVEFDVRPQLVAELDERPATPSVPATLGAFIPPPRIFRRATRRHLRVPLVAHVFPATSSAYYTGYWPASAAPIPAYRSSHRRRHVVAVPVEGVTAPAEIVAEPFSHHRHIAPFIN